MQPEANIWILQHYATPPDTSSGGRHFNFAKLLLKFKYRTTIFASSFNHSTLNEERIKNGDGYLVEEREGVRFFWVKTCRYERNDWRRVLNMMTYCVRAYIHSNCLQERPAIVWASNPHLLAGFFGYLLARKHRAHFIFEVRDLWPQVLVDVGSFSRANPLIAFLRLLEKFIYSRAERIIVLMSQASKYLLKHGALETKIIYLPHALDVELFGKPEGKPPQPMESEIRRLRANNTFIAGYVGAHGVADALDTLIECCRLLQSSDRRDIHIVMVGHGTEKRRLERKAAEMGLRNISFHPPVPKSAIPNVMKLFDAGIVCKKDTPLYRYGTSFIKTFDYMASSIPILWAVNSPDCPVLDAHCGLAVPAEHPDEMAKALVTLACMTREARQEMGRNGLEYVRQHHDNQVAAQTLKAVLDSILTSPQ